MNSSPRGVRIPPAMSFRERGQNHVVFVTNEGTTPAKVQVPYLVPAGTANAALRIDQPAPAGCNP